MSLSADLISEFVKSTKDTDTTKKETIAYGEVVERDGVTYVRLDGSDILTPIDKTADVKPGERVTVMIKNHTAIITGNITSPAARTADVETIRAELLVIDKAIIDKASINELKAAKAEIELLLAKKASIEELEAERAEIDELIAKKIGVEELEAERAEIEELIAKKATVEQLNAQKAEINELLAKKATIDQLIAQRAEVNELIAKKATIEQLEAARAEIDELIAKKATIEQLNAEKARIDNLVAEDANIKNLVAGKADISVLNAGLARIDTLEAEDATIKGTLEANKAKIENLEVTKLSAKDAEIKYANIDFSNIGKAAMEYLYAESGLIKDVTIGDATITGEIVGVTIRGDRIIGNTIMADKLVIKGEDGIYYKLNIEAGATTSEQITEEQLQNGLHGKAIIAKTITADKITVTDLVAFGATIGGFNITNKSIYSGVKESAGNTTRGIYLDNEGQFVAGDATNFFKYYKDTDGTYKLAISADSIKIGASKKSVEEAIQEAKDELQSQIDGSITSWFYEEAPTNSNEPAVNWTTPELKNAHLGDLYYETDTGYCYRWMKNGDTYEWGRITDSDVTKALEDAAKAKDVADNAKQAADNAQNTANDAQNTADNARNTANAANEAVKKCYTKTETDTQISQTKDAILLEASGKYTTKTEFNDLSIGGRNLFTDTVNFLGSDWVNSVDWPIDGVDSIGNARRKQGTWAGMSQLIYAKAGETYTVSATIVGDGVADVRAYASMYSEKDIYSATVSGVMPATENFGVASTTEKRYKFTVNITADGYLRARFENGIDNSYLCVSSMKLEKGNRATDWTPAPEDYYSKKETDARIEVLPDSISSRVRSEMIEYGFVGKNYYSNEQPYSRLVTHDNGPWFARPDPECPNGFKITGAPDESGTIRLDHVITGNGLWTVSFYIRSSQNIAYNIQIDVCDCDPKIVTMTADNEWVKHSYTFNVTNYSEDVYHFIDFEGIGWAYYLFKDFKVEKGEVATDWTPHYELDRVMKETLMTQTEDGWTFNTKVVQGKIDEAKDEVQDEVDALGERIDSLEEQNYVKIGTYTDADGNVKPSIELSESDSEFKSRITNTEMIFGSVEDGIEHIHTVIDKEKVEAEKIVVKDELEAENVKINGELQHGSFIWKTRDKTYVINNNVYNVTNNEYAMGHWCHNTIRARAGDRCRITIDVTPAAGAYYALYHSGGSAHQCYLRPSGTGRQTISAEYTVWYYGSLTPDVNPCYGCVNLYRFPNNGSVTENTTIHSVKVERIVPSANYGLTWKEG